jgi:hypothetical protein
VNRPRLLLVTAAVSLVVTAAAASERAADAGAISPQCSAPEYRRLDFWAGDWDAWEEGATKSVRVARCQVDRILDGCVLREVYEQDDGLVGQSFTIYDASRKMWHQSWVTNRGLLLTIEGKFDGGALTLEGPLRSPDAKAPEKIIRGVWRKEPGGVRETAETSADGGKTWNPYFDIHFRPHAGD